MEEKKPEHQWWEIVVENFDTERLSGELFDLGIQGTVGTLEGHTTCYFEGSKTGLSSILQHLSDLGLKIMRSAAVPNINWVQKCSEVWQPVSAGSFTVLPLVEGTSEKQHSSAKYPLYIVPGGGFGTGHHSSTSMALRFISDLAHTKPQRVLDVGTGSGILALGAARLFSAPVDALEIDPLALENARENLSANEFPKRINLVRGTIDSISARYDLIISNLYAELHTEYRSRYLQLLSDNGVLILSGIASSKVGEIKEGFAKIKPPFSLVLEDSTESEGWAALLYKIPK